MKYIRFITLVPVLSLLISACVSMPATTEAYPTYTPNPTYTPYPTYEPYPTYTPYPTLVSLSETLDETKSETTKASFDEDDYELTQDREEGTWLVGVEVAPGLWRASGDCWAKILDENGERMGDSVDGNRSILSVPTNAFSVEFISYPETCTWSYLVVTEVEISADLTVDREDGTWLVGVEVAPGKWRSSGDCWAKALDISGNRIGRTVNGNKSILPVPATAFSVEFRSYPDECTWSYLGE